VESRDPEASYRAPDEKGMAAAITVTAQISQNRSIVVQTYLDRDAPVGEFHLVLDKFGEAIERQEAKAHLIEAEDNLALEEKTRRQMLEDLGSIETRSQANWERSNKRGQWKLTDAEAAQKTTAATNVKRFDEAIAKRKGEIAKLQAVIAKGN
jgi:hypothetical protein